MLMSDPAQKKVSAEVQDCKKKITLYPDMQKQSDGSGHSSGDLGGGPPQGAAGGVSGTSKSGGYAGKGSSAKNRGGMTYGY